MATSKIKVGDTVRVIAGKDKEKHKGEQQGVVYVFQCLAVGKNQHHRNHD